VVPGLGVPTILLRGHRTWKCGSNITTRSGDTNSSKDQPPRARSKAQAVVLMQSSFIGGETETPVPAAPDAPPAARGRAKSHPEPPACAPQEVSGWEVCSVGSQQWEAQPDVVIKFHSFD